MAGTNLTYAGNNLQTASIITQDINHETSAEIDAKIYALAHANLSAVPFVSYPQRSLSIKGQLVGASISAVDSLVDTFKSYFITSNQPFLLDYAGGSLNRLYTAVPNVIKVDRPGGLLYANFEVDFVCPIPFGMDTSQTTALTMTARTLATYTDAYTFLGTAPVQWPVITITYSVLTGGTNATVAFGNAGNGQQINITRNWTVGDVLVIDVTQSVVTVNGIAVAFSGAFPEFPPVASSFYYSDGFATRTFAGTVKYTKMYM